MMLMIKKIIVRIVVKVFIDEGSDSSDFENFIVLGQIIEYDVELAPVEDEFGVIPFH
jgi:hypothetical protein